MSNRATAIAFAGSCLALALGLSACNNNLVRSAVGMAPTTNAKVTNASSVTVCDLNIAEEGQDYVESYSKLGPYDHIEPGESKTIDLGVHQGAFKVKAKTCDGTVLTEKRNLQSGPNGSNIEIVVH